MCVEDKLQGWVEKNDPHKNPDSYLLRFRIHSQMSKIDLYAPGQITASSRWS